VSLPHVSRLDIIAYLFDAVNHLRFYYTIFFAQYRFQGILAGRPIGPIFEAGRVISRLL
jgi:hypothetical protein